jgi:hypothetical protein
MQQRLHDRPRANADRVKAMVSRLVESFETASAMQCMLAGINDDETLRTLFENRYEAHGCNLVHHALLAQLLMLLTAMYDERDHRRDNRASLPSIMHQLADKAVIRRLIEDARSWLPGHAQRFRQRNACAAARSIMRARIRYEALATRASHRERVQRLRHLRNEHFAHSLVQLPKCRGPLYGWFDELRHDTEPIISDLCFAVEGRNPEFHDADEEWSRKAAAFLARLRTGMETEDPCKGDLAHG